MNKATHRGHCQVCNAIQKLPDNLLAAHGYRVEQRGFGGWFSGTCRGSHNLPFERDKRLVDESITNALSLADLKRAHAKDLTDKPADPAKCMIHHYSKRLWQYMWVEAALLPGTDAEHPGFHPRYDYNGEQHVMRNSFRDLQQAAEHQKGNYISHLESEAKKLDGYVVMQRKRLESWRPDAPLLPVKD